MKFLISLLLFPAAIALIVMAVLGKPRMVWGKSGTNYFTRGQQAVVCSFWSMVLLVGAILGVAASLPRNRVSFTLMRVSTLISPITLITMFFSLPLLVWGVSGLSRNYAQSSLTERARDLGVAFLGAFILIADILQIIMASK
jgi:hypothetical protein